MVEAVLEDGRGRRLVVRVATTRLERLRGLLGRPPLRAGTALLLPAATSLHTVGMRYPIEVAWLDRELRVLAVRTLPPGRLAAPRPKARHVLECPVGTGLRAGDRLRIVWPPGQGPGGPAEFIDVGTRSV